MQSRTKISGKVDHSVIQKTFNGLIKNKSNVLTEGFLLPICKPGTDPTAPESYGPIKLLSPYRKLLCLILLQRINPILENSLSNSQFAYRPGKSTGYVVLAYMYPIAAVKAKGPEKVCIGFHMSKVFETMQREKPLELLTVRIVDTGVVTLITHLLENTTLNIKIGKIIGRACITNVNDPLGYGLSPRLFTLYLKERLKKNETEFHIGVDHSYARQNSALPIHDHDYRKSKILSLLTHLEHADDVDFSCKN